MADQVVMAMLSVKCGVGAPTSKGVITGASKEPEVLFIGLEVFGIAGVARRGSGGENNDHLSRRWIESFATVDADRESQDLDLFFECIVLRDEGEHPGVADLKKISFVSFCDPVIELFSGFFCVFARGFIV